MLTVGLVIPFHNHSQFLEETLESVLDQTRLPDRVILVDDGSTLTEAKLALEMCVLYGYHYIHHDENRGPSAARNTGIRRLRQMQPAADIVICLDADDLIAPGYVGMMVDALDEHPEAWVAYPDVQMVGFESRVVKCPSVYDPSILISRPFVVAGSAFRMAMWESVYQYNGTGWDVDCDRSGWEDYLFWMEGLLGVRKGDPKAAVHAGPDRYWYVYRRFDRPDRSDGNEQALWQYFSGKMQNLYGVTLPPMREEWLRR